MAAADEIKKLSSLTKSLQTDIDMYEDTTRELRKKFNDAMQKLEFFKQTPTLSDHALVRYIERIMKVNVQEIKDKILSPEIKALIDNGASRVSVDGVTFVVRNKNVVTIVD